MQPTTNPTSGSTTNTTKPQIDWQKMSTQQREEFKAAKKAAALAKVKGGDFPKGIRIKVGDFSLTLHPSGVSDKGSVSYSLSPTTLELGGRKLRVNKVSMSVLAETDLATDFGPIEEGDILG